MNDSKNCPQCKAPNEPGRDVCWQCYRPLGGASTSSSSASGYSASGYSASSGRSSVLSIPEKPASAYVDYAGFWVRVYASLIDSFFISLIVGPLMFAALGTEISSSGTLVQGPVGIVVTWVVPSLIILGFWIVKSATPGKMLFGLRIVDAETFGEPSLMSWLLRYMGYIVSSLFLCLGYIWVAFDDKKQGWHDKMAGTVVVKAYSLPKNARASAGSSGGGGMAFAGLIILVIVGSIFLGVSKITSSAGNLKKQGEETKKEAEAFGRGRTTNECLNEALGRDSACSNFVCHMKAKMFLQESLKTATLSPGFCVGIPPSTDILNSSLWRVRQCQLKGRDDSYCGGLFEAVQLACEGK